MKFFRLLKTFARILLKLGDRCEWQLKSPSLLFIRWFTIKIEILSAINFHAFMECPMACLTIFAVNDLFLPVFLNLKRPVRITQKLAAQSDKITFAMGKRACSKWRVIKLPYRNNRILQARTLDAFAVWINLLSFIPPFWGAQWRTLRSRVTLDHPV